MTAKWIELVTGPLEEKRRWRRFKHRKEQLPAGYRRAMDGLERYFMYAAPIAKGDVYVQMLEDLVDLVERAAVDGTPVRSIVGEDPVEFAEAFIANYADGQWIDKERRRLVETIDRSAEEV
ncbi:DUF1048 domain-containing protein [Arthrobacter sp. zg-Y895]|uniref:DUF1048 domain-containing protein n=1 Tax=Arthrobacter sp. zg-Y895 TaxID=2886933 RepID=UPI001D1366B9|nr:DUF1048 domain-containing protein [Arthrobacter sp. zg-Y895]MCC3301646.1 DUF1048 domain-containing protein [Arthrobacter sp. zg-Y895]